MMSPILTGVIFDQSTIFARATDSAFLDELKAVLLAIKRKHLKLGIFSTHPLNLDALLQQYDLPAVDLFLSKQDVGKNKGAKEWIQRAAQAFNCAAHQLVYVGDEKRDWLTAINSGTFYLHAKWTNTSALGVTAFPVADPADVWFYLSHFLLPPPRWEYSLDLPSRRVHIRSLLSASVQLESTKPTNRFKLQDIFTYLQTVDVGEARAQDFLMMHAISSLYLEGLISPGTLFAVYPSSTPGKTSLIDPWLEPAAKVFHGYFKKDLIVRAVKGVDTSLERAQGRRQNVTFGNQTNTVHLNPVYARRIRGKRVIVFDDFTTSGMSLEWARNLLIAAGVSQVVSFSIGKYKSTHTVYAPYGNAIITPFLLRRYTAGEFVSILETMAHNQVAQELIKRSSHYVCLQQPLPNG